MKIQQKDYFHGAALTQIVEHKFFTALNTVDRKYGHYQVNHNIRLMFKYRTDHGPSWSFTFQQSDIDVIKEDFDSRDQLFLCLICGLETICMLDVEQIGQLLDLLNGGPQWIQITANKGGSLWARSKCGELPYAIRHNDFPDRLFDF